MQAEHPPSTHEINEVHEMAAPGAPMNATSEGMQKVIGNGQNRDGGYVLTFEEIGNLAREGGKPAETLMNVVKLIARRFQTEVCSVYLLEPDRANLVAGPRP